MTAISIVPAQQPGTATAWRAVANGKEAFGRTAGEALDGLTAELSQAGVFLIYEQWQPDEFFTAEQQQRLSELLARWRLTNDSGEPLAANEQVELEQLIEVELLAAGQRAATLAHEAKP